jgi:hypothetical protein
MPVRRDVLLWRGVAVVRRQAPFCSPAHMCNDAMIHAFVTRFLNLSFMLGTRFLHLRGLGGSYAGANSVFGSFTQCGNLQSMLGRPLWDPGE